MKEGRGVYRGPDGDTYEGIMRNDKMEGTGVFRWANGNIYEGSFRNGLKDGAGVIRYANGNIYEGNWRNDKMEGTGVFTGANGNFYDGGWKNGDYEGRGVVTYAVDSKLPDELGGYSYNSKDKFDGVFKAGKRHGACTYTFFNGETFRCTFVEGRCAEFDQRQAAVRAAPDAASVQARAAKAAAEGLARSRAFVRRVAAGGAVAAAVLCAVLLIRRRRQ